MMFGRKGKQIQQLSEEKEGYRHSTLTVMAQNAELKAKIAQLETELIFSLPLQMRIV